MISVQTQTDCKKIMRNIILKKKKEAGGMVQVVGCLSSKCKALSSNPSSTKKNHSISKHSIKYQNSPKMKDHSRATGGVS
jgi:hypothetical protein